MAHSAVDEGGGPSGEIVFARIAEEFPVRAEGRQS
jgi:hypothetical protein